MLGAVLGRNLLATKSDLTGAVIGLFDQGYSMQALSGALMRLDIWGTLAGGTSNSHIANYLLTTVKQAAPDATTLAEAVAAKLAVHLAGNLTESGSRIDAARNYLRDILAQAKAIDAQEGGAASLVVDAWLQARG